MDTSEYKEYGWDNDKPNTYHNEMLRKVERLLPKDGSAILDIGCGNGFIANSLIHRGYNVYGMDASAAGVKIANQKNPNHFYVCDVVAMKLPKELDSVEFKTVISTEVIEHLYSPKSYVAFVGAILGRNGGGSFIVTTPYHGYFKNVLVALTNRSDYHFCPLWEGGHIKFWSRAMLTKLLQNEGFDGFVFRGIGHVPYLWKIMVLKADLAPADEKK